MTRLEGLEWRRIVESGVWTLVDMNLAHLLSGGSHALAWAASMRPHPLRTRTGEHVYWQTTLYLGIKKHEYTCRGSLTWAKRRALLEYRKREAQLRLKGQWVRYGET